MDYKFTLELSRDYFIESFWQSTRHANKIRKIEYIISVVFILSGIALYIYANGETMLPLVFIAIGLFEYFSPYLKKYFWLKRQMGNKSADTTVEIHITDDAILTKGVYSEGCMRWEGMNRVLETPKGIILWPQKGIHIYIPKSKITPDVIKYVLSKVT